MHGWNAATVRAMLAAAGLVIIMSGATGLTLAGGAGAGALVPLVAGLLAAFVAYGRCRLAPQRGRAGRPAAPAGPLRCVLPQRTCPLGLHPESGSRYGPQREIVTADLGYGDRAQALLSTGSQTRARARGGGPAQPLDVAHRRGAEEPLVVPAEVRHIVVAHP